MPKSFVDSGVLIDAARAERTDHGLKALEYLADPELTCLTSPFIRMETVPKATFTKRISELEFYVDFFADPRVEWCREWERMAAIADEQARQYGLGALDAFHLAAAYILGADELVTTEKPQKPIYRSQLVRVVYLYTT
jgi:predicted nucleic acid-binding protein